MLGVDGAVYALKGAPNKGSAKGRMHGVAVAIAPTATGGGYYILDSHGDIFVFGDAKSYGSMKGKRLNAPIIALAPTPSGHGYWLLGRDGGIFTFGDARVLRIDGRPPVEQADHLDGRDARAATATGCSRPTAVCSASATRPSTVRPATSGSRRR